MTVIGLDVSVVKTGLALPDGQTRTLRTSAGADERLRRLWELEGLVAGTVKRYPPTPLVAFVEGYALGSPGRQSLVTSAEAGGVVRSALYALGVLEVIEVPPSRLKRYATGSGGADKAGMIRAALAEGAVLTSPNADDEADAFLLRHLGRALLELDPPPSDPARLDVLEKVRKDHVPALRMLATSIARGRGPRAI